MPTDSDKTLLDLFGDRVANDGDEPAIRFKRSGQWLTETWHEIGERVSQAVAALTELGVRPGDRVIQFSENRVEWIECDLAIQFCGAIHVPVHAPLTGPQAAYQIKDCGARVVLISGEEQAAKLQPCFSDADGDWVFVSYDQSQSAIRGETPSLWSETKSARQPATFGPLDVNGVATILYTSGTTGEPKGVMLSQRNLTSNTLATLQAFSQFPEDVRLTFLPFSHIFARTCDVYTWLASGSQLAIAESRETVIADCAEVKPTLLNGVPYFFDRVRRALDDAGQADVDGSLKSLLGGQMRFCCSGGAALPNHVFDFYERHGVPILQGYGLTETSPVITASTQQSNRQGCAGPPIPGVEVRIADDGEILTRGPHVMLGYYKNETATNEVIRDGWFHTGDLGQLEEDGLLRITGRKKEIIVTSGGKNVSPVYLETLLTEDLLILQALVVGDGRNYLSALIVPDADQLVNEISVHNIKIPEGSNAREHADVRSMFEQRIRKRLSNVSQYEQIGCFKLIDRAFTIENGELTPKLSLRRKVIEENFANDINAMYER